MVDFCLEAEDGGLERILGWESDVKDEGAALYGGVQHSRCFLTTAGEELDDWRPTAYGVSSSPVIVTAHVRLSASFGRDIFIPGIGSLLSSESS